MRKKTAAFRSSIGVDIEVLGEHLNQEGSQDPSQDLLFHLAGAYQAVKRLEDAGVVFNFSNRELVLDALRQAYREGLFVRAHRTPVELIDTSTISRYGRLQR